MDRSVAATGLVPRAFSLKRTLAMLTESLHPLRFEPILKELIWGGRRLGTVLGKPLGAGEHYAESWEIADHRDDVSRVAEDRLKGTTLRELVRRRGVEVLGPAVGPVDQFPLLVKFLDANQVLSVQVHPDDERGRRLANDNGKTEAWVIIHAEPGSLIYAGLRPGVTRSRFAEAMRDGTVEPLLHRFEPRPGDCIMIPAGTVHAIGAGVVLAEIQQMSDATFRVHDWGRVGVDGKPRQLHPDESLESTDFDSGPVDPVASRPEPIDGGTLERLARCPYFALERLRLEGPAVVGDADRARFTILIGLGGTAEVRHETDVTSLGFGQTLLLPAALGACRIAPQPGGEALVLTCTVP
jgi:mannose-6-phosphate isomerase